MGNREGKKKRKGKNVERKKVKATRRVPTSINVIVIRKVRKTNSKGRRERMVALSPSREYACVEIYNRATEG